MGLRADAVLLQSGFVFVLEFKIGSASFTGAAIEQLVDYSLDIKNFHGPSHSLPIVPILICTESASADTIVPTYADGVSQPVFCSANDLQAVIGAYTAHHAPPIDTATWRAGTYKPTPTIIEAARALYAGHNVLEISRSEAGAENLTHTTAAVEAAIDLAKAENRKVLCFITGVPGSGKTLAGLNIATRRREHLDEHAVFLSGNGPLVEEIGRAHV
jgi:hypothetical protein